MADDLARLGLVVDANGFIRADKAMANFNRTAKTTEKQAALVNKEVDRMAMLARRAGQLLGAIGVGIGARELIGYADSWRQVNNQLRQVTSSESELLAVRKNLRTVSSETNTALESTVSLYSTIVRSTREMKLSSQEVADVTKTVNNLFMVSGSSAQEAANAIRQMSQGLAAGALRGEEFNSVAENAPRIMDAIAEKLQMTRGELRAFAAEGGITSQILVESLQDYSEEAQRMADITDRTFGQKMVNAKDNVMEFAGEANALNSAIDLLGDGIVGLSDNLGTLVTAGEVVTVILAARMTPAVIANTTAWTANAAATARAAGGLGVVRGALSLIGGPTGALTIAGIGAYYLMDAYTSLDEKTKDLVASIRDQNDALEDLTKTQLKQAIQANKQHLDQLSLRLAKEQELANANVQFGIVDLKQTKTLNALTAEHEALTEVVAAQTGRLAELHGEVARAAEQEWADYYDGLFKSREEAEQADRTIEGLILKLAEERAMLTMTAKEQDIYNFLKGEGATATQEQRNRVIAMISALHDERAALDALNDAANDAEDGIEDLGDKSAEVSEAMIRDWQNVRQSFGEFFADLVLEGGNAFDALLKSWERTALQMAGSSLFDIGASALGFSIPGGSGGNASNAFMSAAGSKLLPGLTKPGAVITDAELQQLLGGKSTSAGGLNLTDLKSIGMNIGAGIAGSFAGNAVGEGIFGKEAESQWASAAGGTVGAMMGGPLGAFIGSAIGSMVDVAFGGDGKVRTNAGFLAAPTPGLKQEYNAGSHTFASGLDVTLFARRTDASAAREILDVFDQVDRSFVDLVKELGGDISVSQLSGLDEEANPGSRGTFFGLGGNGTTQGDILAQVNAYVNQLADNVTGLDQALLDSIRSASTAEEALAELTKALALEQINDKLDPLRAKTRAYEEDLELLQQVYTEGSAEYEDAAKKLRDLHGLNADAAERHARALAGVRSIIDPLNDRISALTQQIQSDISMLSGLVDDPIQRLIDLRDLAWDNHNEQIRAEEALHNRRLDLAESLSDYITNLSLGNLSPLSNQAKFELAQADFRSTLQAALGGDVDAAGRLQGSAQAFAEQSQSMFASSSTHKGNMAEILAGLEQAAGILGSSTFDPQQANNRLVEELQRINAQLELIPGQIGAELAGPMGAFIQAARAAGVPDENIANIVKGLGPSAEQGANAAVPGFTDSATSAFDIQAYVDAQRSKYSGVAGGELLALEAIANKAKQKNISSSMLADALGLSKSQLQKNLDMLAGAGIPGFASGVTNFGGGMALVGERGPELVELPSGSNVHSNSQSMGMMGAANDELISEVRALREEVADLKRIDSTGHQLAAQQRAQQIAIAGETNQKLDSQEAVGSRRYSGNAA